MYLKVIILAFLVLALLYFVCWMVIDSYKYSREQRGCGCGNCQARLKQEETLRQEALIQKLDKKRKRISDMKNMCMRIENFALSFAFIKWALK